MVSAVSSRGAAFAPRLGDDAGDSGTGDTCIERGPSQAAGLAWSLSWHPALGGQEGWQGGAGASWGAPGAGRSPGSPWGEQDGSPSPPTMCCAPGASRLPPLPQFRGHSALAASHAGSLVSSEPGNPLRHGATAGCGRRGACERGAEPKPSRRGGIAAFPLPFELRQPPGAAVPPSTDRGAGAAAGSSGEHRSQESHSYTGAARRGHQELGGRWAHAGAIPGETGGEGSLPGPAREGPAGTRSVPGGARTPP